MNMTTKVGFNRLFPSVGGGGGWYIQRRETQLDCGAIPEDCTDGMVDQLALALVHLLHFIVCDAIFPIPLLIATHCAMLTAAQKGLITEQQRGSLPLKTIWCYLPTSHCVCFTSVPKWNTILIIASANQCHSCRHSLPASNPN